MQQQQTESVSITLLCQFVPQIDGAALTEALDGVLDDAQRQRWQDWQVRRRSARVEARASTALAEIESALVLDGAQPQAVREAMSAYKKGGRQQAEEKTRQSRQLAQQVIEKLNRLEKRGLGEN